MKTNTFQIFTIAGFFSISLMTTLAFSWGIHDLISTSEASPSQLIVKTKHEIALKANYSKSLHKAIKLLIPKINNK